jgi:hypothetical protein
MESSSLQFAAVVRILGTAARSLELVVPGFRTPPRRPGIVRTIRRGADGGATVAVASKDRPAPAVVADLIEGIVVVNQLDGVEAARVRTELWAAVVADEPGLASFAGAA